MNAVRSDNEDRHEGSFSNFAALIKTIPNRGGCRINACFWHQV
jgi:hypothetical protein